MLEMEGNNSSGLEWENLALFTGNPNIHIPISSSSSSSTCNEFGLGLGQHNEYSASTRALMSSSLSSIPVSSMSMPMPMPLPLPTKRSRASYHNMQNPCCQVEGCNLDLKLAKDYHRRHRICETHSKSPKVIVAGMERRFCQQCSRFHDLSEFDDKKRSCRRRLSDHNARRRRVQPDSVQLTGISPAALYAADQRQQNVLLNGLPVSTWENGLIRPRGLQGTLNFATDDDLSNLHTSNHCHHVHVAGSTNSSSMAPDLLNAHSLLSSNSWSLNQGESPSMEGNYSPDLTLFQTNNVNIINGGFDLHNANANAAPSHHQEYHLFKAPCDSASFFSSQRSL